VARHRPAAHTDPAPAPRSRLLAPAVIGGVCVVYLVALMTTSLRLDVFRP
jgi:hypothetical protein